MKEARNKIKVVLEQQGRTQVWLSKQIKKSINTVNAYVQNRTQPSIQVLYEIGKVLVIEPSDLLIKTNLSNESK